jgi:hypothetical protein
MILWRDEELTADEIAILKSAARSAFSLRITRRV